MEGNGNGTTWQGWLQDVVKTGLTARWDAEYLERFGVARQVPAQAIGAGGAGAIVPTQGAPMFSPMMLLGGAVALSAALYFLLRD